MYRQVFIPNEQNSAIPIPREWYGKMRVEIIATPLPTLDQVPADSPNGKSILSVQEKYEAYFASLSPEAQQQILQRRKKRDQLIRKYPVDLSNFKFNREEANDYTESSS
jgi:hypothetical protein